MDINVENTESQEVREDSVKEQEIAQDDTELVQEDAESKSSKEQKTEKKAAKAAEKEKAKLNERIAELEKEVAKAKEAAEKEKNDYLRLMADFENLRRHSAEERLNLISTAATDTIKGLLPVLDDCERALEILAKSSDEAAREGTSLIYNKLMAYLKTKGLEVIEAKGKKFDTDFHEAIAQLPVEDESQKGTVIDVVSTGYTINGNMLRFAKVVVGI